MSRTTSSPSLLDVLDTRARHAVEQRFGLNDGRKRSYREVGDELGVTAEAARRLVKRAVNTVKEEAAAARVDAALDQHRGATPAASTRDCIARRIGTIVTGGPVSARNSRISRLTRSGFSKRQHV